MSTIGNQRGPGPAPYEMSNQMNDYDNNYDDQQQQILQGEPVTDKMDVYTRHGFIQKVFGIVGIQLLITTVIAFPFVAYRDSAKEFVMNNQFLLTIAMILPFILICYSFIKPNLLREYPKNYFFLFLYTLCFGMIVGVSCMQFKTPSILFAAGITALIVFSLTIFAMQTSYDFSGMGPYLMCALLCLIVTSFVMSLTGGVQHGGPMQSVIGGFGALLFSFFIVYDVQLISGGKHQKVRFGLDDYAFAALVLYMDIINLFLHILSLIGDRRNQGIRGSRGTLYWSSTLLRILRSWVMAKVLKYRVL